MRNDYITGDVGRKDYKLSEKEKNALQIEERYSALEVAKRLRLDPHKNRLDHIDLELTPYHYFPVSCMGLAEVLWIFGIGPTQSGKTLLAQIFLADRILQDSGTCIYCLPDEKSGKKQFLEKVISLIESSPTLSPHILNPKSQTLTQGGIRLDVMNIFPGWSRSPASMNSITAICAILDEIRLMPKIISGETNAIEYMEDRTTTYNESGRNQHLGITTPRDENDLMYAQLGKPQTTVYWWMIPCPNCGKVQSLDIYKNFQFDGTLYQPRCFCKYCKTGEFNDTKEKKPMNATGIYCKIEDEGMHIEKVEKPKPDKHTIVRWTSENSPFRSFTRICEKYEKSLGDFGAMSNFDQAWRSRFTKYKKSKATTENLRDHIVSIPRGVVPDWTKTITAGVDTQGHGFYCWVYAHGPLGRRHMIDAYLIESDYKTDVDQDVRDLLHDHFETKTYSKADGEKWAITLWGIDTGGNRTTVVYDATAGLKKCIPCKGNPYQSRSSNSGPSIRKTETKKTDELYIVNTKEYLDASDDYCMLSNFTMHADVEDDVLMQFCNIKKVEEKPDKYGNKAIIWESVGQFDYRMACIHADICLDIKIEIDGIVRRLRSRLSSDDFYFNPINDIRYSPKQKEIMRENREAVKKEKEKRFPQDIVKSKVKEVNNNLNENNLAGVAAFPIDMGGDDFTSGGYAM